MAVKHLDDLAEELIHRGILTKGVQEAPGSWTGNIEDNSQ